MQTQSDLKTSGLPASGESQPAFLLNKSQARVMAALMLIGTGLVFSLVYAGFIRWSSPWWVIYIVIPSLMLLYASATAAAKGGKGGRSAISSGVLGLLGLALSVILIMDPTWSFTRAWHLDAMFPFLRGVQWDPVWQWALVLLGVAAAAIAVWRRSVGAGVVGALLVMTGATFLLNLAWDSVWPLFLVVLGAGLLVPFAGNRKR